MTFPIGEAAAGQKIQSIWLCSTIRNERQSTPAGKAIFPFISANYSETEVAISGDSYQAYKKSLALFFNQTNTTS